MCTLMAFLASLVQKKTNKSPIAIIETGSEHPYLPTVVSMPPPSLTPFLSCNLSFLVSRDGLL